MSKVSDWVNFVIGVVVIAILYCIITVVGWSVDKLKPADVLVRQSNTDKTVSVVTDGGVTKISLKHYITIAPGSCYGVDTGVTIRLNDGVLASITTYPVTLSKPTTAFKDYDILLTNKDIYVEVCNNINAPITIPTGEAIASISYYKNTSALNIVALK